jgi:hypothetical protein
MVTASRRLDDPGWTEAILHKTKLELARESFYPSASKSLIAVCFH